MTNDADLVTVCLYDMPRDWYASHKERLMSWAELRDFLFSHVQASPGDDADMLRKAGREYLERTGRDPDGYTWRMAGALSLLKVAGVDLPRLGRVTTGVRLRADSEANMVDLEAVRDGRGRWLYSDGRLTHGAETVSPDMADLLCAVAEDVIDPGRAIRAKRPGEALAEARLAWARRHRDEVLAALDATGNECLAGGDAR